MNKVLYFPHIRVPNTNWFTRILLYWDEVGAIVPYEFIAEPERHDPYTKSLVEENLVRQIIPWMYTYNIPRFTDAFVEYVQSLGPELERRREAFHGGLLKKRKSYRIHLEKLHDVAQALTELGLADQTDYSWLDVESNTGKDFMSYLACTLGKVEELGHLPVTDKPDFLDEFLEAGTSKTEGQKKVKSLRMTVLEKLLPSPNRPLRASEIAEFKNKHGEFLASFRRKVEKELITIAGLKDPGLQDDRLSLFLDESREVIEEIKGRMGEQGWDNLVFGKFCAIIAAIPGVSSVFGLANAVHGAFSSKDSSLPESPYLYAAYAQEDLLAA